MLELRQRYVDALVAGDLALAERLIEDSGTDIRSLYLQVLQPALYEIGRRWQEAEISVAQEHLATATTQSLMARLAGRFDDRAPRRDRRVLVACAEGELHSIGVRMVADFLEADGWDVLFVGALSPPAAVAERPPRSGSTSWHCLRPWGSPCLRSVKPSRPCERSRTSR